jgi:DMSO/TMAO reductase YedYZ molybdopterin-dependent catalytic subunit
MKQKSALDRRDALWSILGLVSMAGCAESPSGRRTPLAFDGTGVFPGTDLTEPFSNGRFLRVLSFFEESPGRIGFKYGRGHDARRSLDVASLAESASRITPTKRHFLRSEFPDLLRPDEIKEILINDADGIQTSISVAELRQRSRSHAPVLMECAGNTGQQLGFGLLSVAEWAGVPLREILQSLTLPESQRVLVSGFDARTPRSTHSAPGASWIFQQQEIERSGAFLATGMNGDLLSPDHGSPVRLVVPTHYGCCQIKWVNEITIVREEIAATPQMIEFALRTHQTIDLDRLSSGVPVPVTEFQPPEIQPSALPVRAELWETENGKAVRIVGISWGGIKPARKLAIRIGSQSPEVPVSIFEPRLNGLPFGLWCHLWVPQRDNFSDGTISMRYLDAGIKSVRMDRGHYSRRLELDAEIFN